MSAALPFLLLNCCRSGQAGIGCGIRVLWGLGEHSPPCSAVRL